MKSRLIKCGAALALMGASAAAFAAANGCCGSIECCMKMLAGCC